MADSSVRLGELLAEAVAIRTAPLGEAAIRLAALAQDSFRLSIGLGPEDAEKLRLECQKAFERTEIRRIERITGRRFD